MEDKLSNPPKVDRADLMFQLALISVSMLIMATQLHLRRKHIFIQDERPELVSTIPASRASHVQLQTGFHINQFHAFDLKDGTFTLSSTVWFELDNTDVSLERLGNFTIENGTIIERSEPDVRTIGEGKQLVTYGVKLSLTSLMNHRYFPLDAHRLFVVLAHRDRDIKLVSEKQDFVVDASLDPFGWRAGNMQVSSGYREIQLDATDVDSVRYYPVAVFSIDLVREGMQYLLLGILLIFYITLLALSAGSQNIAVLASILVAAPGYRVLIQSFTPEVGYLVLSDYLYFIFLFAVFITFLFNILTAMYWHLNQYFVRIAMICIHMGVIASSAYVLWLL